MKRGVQIAFSIIARCALNDLVPFACEDLGDRVIMSYISVDSCDFILRTCATNPPVTRAHKGTCDGGPGGIFG